MCLMDKPKAQDIPAAPAPMAPMGTGVKVKFNDLATSPNQATTGPDGRTYARSSLRVPRTTDTASGLRIPQ
jgi:hypothetical protein